jgi:hypothetical protein
MNLQSEVKHLDYVPSRISIVCFMPLQNISSSVTEKEGVKLHPATPTTTTTTTTRMIEWDTSAIYWADSRLDRLGLISEQG